LKKYLLFGAGTLALVAGCIGIVVPVLPTTPFLLLAAGCYLRSSRRLYVWLTGHRVFGGLIRNYIEHRAIALKAKVFAIVMLWAAIIISIIMVDMLWLRLLLAAIAAGVTIHLLLIKTMPKDDAQ